MTTEDAGRGGSAPARTIPSRRPYGPAATAWRLLASTWPALAAWLLATAVMLVTCAAGGWPPFDARTTWLRWDSGLYLAVAGGGYDLFPCTSPYEPGTWCGNAGWFPAYPWLVGGAHKLGLPLAGTAVALSWLAFAAALVIVWTVFLERRLTVLSAGALLYAAFAPGLVYQYAIFPLSLLALCTVGCLALVHRRRWAAAGVAAGCAALAYPVGLTVAPVAAVWRLLERGDGTPRARVLQAAKLIAPTLVAVAVFATDQRLETGQWDAYLLVQQKYEHALQDPFRAVGTAFSTVWRESPFHLAAVPAVQTLLVTSVLACTLAVVVLDRRRTAGIDRLVASWAAVAWALPLSAANVSVYRSQAALVPLALLVPRLPRPLVVVVAAAAVTVSVPIADLFLRNVLV